MGSSSGISVFDVHHHVGDASGARGQLLESDLSDEDKVAIAGGNARRLFGLDTP